MKVFVTGAAGFIGAAVALRLLERGDDVIGIDDLNDYYDVKLKESRLDRFRDQKKFTFVKADIADKARIAQLFKESRPAKVVHLAAQAGVRYSLTHPHAYTSANIEGFLHILEGCRDVRVEHLVYASSSSVYGANRKMPFSVHDRVDHPVSLYAATKKSNELMAHCYSHLYGIPTTGLRFFTVYGPWGRPDMALFIFTRHILAGTPIELFNHGKHRRDFTYIDDIVEGVIRTLDRTATGVSSWDALTPDPATSFAPYRLYNIGNNSPVWVEEVIRLLEQELGKKASVKLLPMQPGDVLETYADIDDLSRDCGFRPKVSMAEGIKRFVAWYQSYYGTR